jgi:hypothetical protein
MKSLLQYFTIVMAAGLVATHAQAGKIDHDLPRISYIQYQSVTAPRPTLTLWARLPTA